MKARMKKPPVNSSGTNAKCIERFVALSRNYCELIENLDSNETFLRCIHELLPKLYSAALDLPSVDTGSSKPLRSAVSMPKWQKVFHALQQKIGDCDRYHEVFSAYESTDSVTGMLSDDLADMYGDLKSGLAAYDQDSACSIAEAVWHWRFNFRAHWGEHLTGALRALYWLERDEKI